LYILYICALYAVKIVQRHAHIDKTELPPPLLVPKTHTSGPIFVTPAVIHICECRADRARYARTCIYYYTYNIACVIYINFKKALFSTTDDRRRKGWRVKYIHIYIYEGRRKKNVYIYTRSNPLCRAMYRPPNPTRRSARSNEQFEPPKSRPLRTHTHTHTHTSITSSDVL